MCSPLGSWNTHPPSAMSEVDGAPASQVLSEGSRRVSSCPSWTRGENSELLDWPVQVSWREDRRLIHCWLPPFCRTFWSLQTLLTLGLRQVVFRASCFIQGSPGGDQGLPLTVLRAHYWLCTLRLAPTVLRKAGNETCKASVNPPTAPGSTLLNILEDG